VPGSNGLIRVLRSNDGLKWVSAALLAEKGIDLRDPKFCEMPDGRLMLLMGGSVYAGDEGPKTRRRVTAQTRVAFSVDGRSWNSPRPVSVPEHDWLWRVTWHKGTGYGFSYSQTEETRIWRLTLWRTTNGLDYVRTASPDTPTDLFPDETTIRFWSDGSMLALVRNENRRGPAYVGRSKPPFTDWSFANSGHTVQGPNFIVLPDGRMLYSGRDYSSDGPKTVVGVMMLESCTPLLTLPSGGDTSYPGMVWHDGLLWLSYYASHEGKAAIYLARLKAK
jgi:hypothetical protein